MTLLLFVTSFPLLPKPKTQNNFLISSTLMQRAFVFELNGQEHLLFGTPTLAAICNVSGLKENSFEVTYYDQEGDVIACHNDMEFVEMNGVAEELEPDGIAFEFYVTVKGENKNDEPEASVSSLFESYESSFPPLPVGSLLQYTSPSLGEKNEVTEEKKEERKEEAKEDFPLPDFYKAKVIELDGILGDIGCVGIPRGRLIELLFEHNWKIEEPLLAVLLEERARMVGERKDKAKEELKKLLDSELGERVCEKMAEKLVAGEENMLGAFVEIMLEMRNKH
uniref:Uncharacterized protein n=1 Tax=Paramoeba aestuarina TaxID=180227 RepID=A0A7S4KMS4_9EUKA|mmetsp:Transcript_21860/g.33986  ORF Transcript_21860/g.33986 Transcript_21860/m.33986 type:complete len:280 (+) Transcript_21860:42-881(+)